MKRIANRFNLLRQIYTVYLKGEKRICNSSSPFKPIGGALSNHHLNYNDSQLAAVHNFGSLFENLKGKKKSKHLINKRFFHFVPRMKNLYFPVPVDSPKLKKNKYLLEINNFEIWSQGHLGFSL